MIISGIGRLGKEPTMQFTDKGVARTNMNAAVRAGFGESEKTLWVSLVAYGAQAEFLNKHLVKGQRLGFTAEVTNLRTYEKRDQSTGVSLDAKILTFDLVDFTKKEESEPDEF